MQQDPGKDAPRVIVRGPRRDRGTGVVFGVLLIALGVFTLLQRITHVNFSFVPLVVGITFLTAWGRNHRRGFLVAGGVLTGLGAGSLAGSFAPRSYGGFLSMTGLAFGFILAGVLSKRRGLLWEYVVAAGILFSTLLSNSFIAFSAPAARIAFPLSIIVIGSLLIFRSSVPQRFWRVTMAAAILVAILTPNATGFDVFPRFATGAEHRFSRVIGLPSAKNITITTDSIDVRVVTSTDAVSATLLGEGRGIRHVKRIVRSARVEVVPSEDSVSVTVSTERQRFGDSLVLELGIPPGLPDPSGSIAIETRSGDVAVAVRQDLKVHVVTETGDIAVNGFGAKGVFEHDFTSPDGSTGSLMIRTRSGYIALKQLDGAVPTPTPSSSPPAPVTTTSALAPLFTRYRPLQLSLVHRRPAFDRHPFGPLASWYN